MEQKQTSDFSSGNTNIDTPQLPADAKSERVHTIDSFLTNESADGQAPTDNTPFQTHNKRKQTTTIQKSQSSSTDNESHARILSAKGTSAATQQDLISYGTSFLSQNDAPAAGERLASPAAAQLDGQPNLSEKTNTSTDSDMSDDIVSDDEELLARHLPCSTNANTKVHKMQLRDRKNLKKPNYYSP